MLPAAWGSIGSSQGFASRRECVVALTAFALRIAYYGPFSLLTACWRHDDGHDIWQTEASSDMFTHSGGSATIVTSHFRQLSSCFVGEQTGVVSLPSCDRFCSPHTPGSPPFALLTNASSFSPFTTEVPFIPCTFPPQHRTFLFLLPFASSRQVSWGKSPPLLSPSTASQRLYDSSAGIGMLCLCLRRFPKF